MAPIVNRLEQVLAGIVQTLRAMDIGFAVVGGLAVSARTEPRFTRDVDLAIAVPDDHAAERLVRELLARGYTVSSTVEHESAGRLATARLLPPDGTEEAVVLDLLFASSGVEQEVVGAAEPLELFPRIVVPVASAAHLIALKVLSSDPARPQDEVDLQLLLRQADTNTVERAEDALRRITARGYHRGRDLLALLQVRQAAL